LPRARRLEIIYTGLARLAAEFKPDVVALEDVFFGKDVRAMVRIGEARACALLAASGQGVEVIEYPPARVKQAVTGNGRATKLQMQHMVRRLLGLTELPPADGADALAAAICHLHTRGARTAAKATAERAPAQAAG
jgi:crossover junction endodeoxyribonuclease RuvC